jgi:signal transduction histidine kinase
MRKSILQAIDLKTKVLFSMVLLLYVAAPFALNPALLPAEHSDELLILNAAQALPLDVAVDALPEHHAEWLDVQFPLHWREQFSESRAVWYRMQISQQTLDGLAVEGERLGIYLWRLNQTADMWLNGQLVGSGGRTEDPMVRYWNSPLYFNLPQSLLGHNNELLIKHYAERGWGSMEPVILGADSVLRPVYEQRYFIQHDLALGLFVFVLVTGGLSLLIWVYRRQESEYLWFSIASLGLSFYCLNQFIRYLPVSSDLWRWLSNISIDLWAVAVFLFILRSMKIGRPRAEKLAFLYLGLGVPLYFYASFFSAFDINIYFHLGSILIGIYLFYLCFGVFRDTGDLLPVFYCFAIILVIIAGLHDVLMQAAVNNGWNVGLLPGFENHFNFTHFAAPLIFAMIAINLMKRFVLSMNAADETNEQLELRVAQARDELAANYKAMETVLKAQSAQSERERIYRDLHDDVGSKLLSLFYRLDREADSLLAKSALEDLRDIVSHKSLDGCSLNEALQQWHAEAEDRVRDAGIRLDWRCESDLGDFELTEMQRTQLRRMLREVISNALLHSNQLTEIRATIERVEKQLHFNIDNNGSHSPVSEWQVGRGISNLRVRARNLAGSFELIDLTGDWVRVSWSVPLDGDHSDFSGSD